MFNDASQFIQGASATVLDIAATDEIELTSTLIDVVGNLAVSGTIVGASTLSATTGTFSGILKTDDATEATSTTDGSLQTDGGLSVAADAIDIAATYVGQNTITTLGTIATGVWNGTTVGVQHGGTGAATFTDNGVIYGNGTGALSVTAVSADSGSVLQTLTPGGVPVFSNIIDCGEY